MKSDGRSITQRVQKPIQESFSWGTSLEANTSFLEDARDLLSQLEKVQHGLRAMGVGHAFGASNGNKRQAIECWLLIERLLEVSEELGEMCNQLLGGRRR